MSDFISAIVSILYAVVCLANEVDQGKCSTLYPAEDDKKKETGR
jgi:hypothetical protein